MKKSGWLSRILLKMMTPKWGCTWNGSVSSVNGLTQPLYIPVIQGGQRHLTSDASFLKSLRRFVFPIQPNAQKIPHPTYFPVLSNPKRLIPTFSPSHNLPELRSTVDMQPKKTELRGWKILYKWCMLHLITYLIPTDFLANSSCARNIFTENKIKITPRTITTEIKTTAVEKKRTETQPSHYFDTRNNTRIFIKWSKIFWNPA